MSAAASWTGSPELHAVKVQHVAASAVTTIEMSRRLHRGSEPTPTIRRMTACPSPFGCVQPDRVSNACATN
jgi:hypothetical protein